MEIRNGQRYEALLNRGEADVWYAGTAEGKRIRLDDYPYGEPVVGAADVAVLRPEGDGEAYFRWWVTDTRTGKRRKTRHQMQPRADMAGNDDSLTGPFVPDLGSREVRAWQGLPAGYLGRSTGD